MSEKFVLNEFIDDLIKTFPEHTEDLSKYKDLTVEEFSKEHGKIYADNFFDILYKNEKIFNADVDNCFLPNVSFNTLWNDNIGDKTKENIWKYLQLILFSIISKSNDDTFMDNIEHLEDINYKELSNKIEETISNMTGDDLPDADKINESMKGMLDGKLGDLAKEIAGESVGSLDNEEDLNNLLKDPTKLMSLVKNVGDKLDNKIKTGELNESDLMSEATDLLGKMNDIPGFGSIKDMMGNLGLNPKNMNMSATENKMKQHQEKNKTKERLKKKLKKRKENKSI